ncbi:MAG: cyclophilin-like fold protein [Eubacteriales bacterium]|nr:cyclophilin-like fold protein [Eubacteriales bacterium]
MKKIIISMLALALTAALSACSGGQDVEDNTTAPEVSGQPETTPEEQESESFGLGGPLVRLTFEGGEAMVRLNDNEAAQSFAAQLPMTQTFEDFNSIEKICRLPEELETDGVESGVDPAVADITLYVPWNTLVFYYEDYGFNDDLIPMGRVESGMDLLTAMGDEFEVTMELVDGNTADATEPSSETAGTTDIRMTAGDTVITATLDNSETTQAFLDTLPRTLTMNHYGGREYYGRMESLPENGEEIADFENGDVTYFPAGPSFTVFFAGEDSSDQDGLIRMGKITSDLSVFDTLGDEVEMRIEVAQ